MSSETFMCFFSSNQWLQNDANNYVYTKMSKYLSEKDKQTNQDGHVLQAHNN